MQGTNVAVIEQIAESLRRVAGNEEYDAQGVRTLWHRGQMQSELLTWEHRDGRIVKQELSFLGLVVEYRDNAALRTGHVPELEAQSVGGGQAGHAVELDEQPNGQTLEHASHLLKSASTRDHCLQHLLGQVNDALTALGANEYTKVTSVKQFLDGESQTKPMRSVRPPQAKKPPTAQTASLGVPAAHSNPDRTSLVVTLVAVAIIAGLLGFGVWIML